MAIRVLDDGEDIQAAVFGGRSSSSVLNYMRQQAEAFAPLIKDNEFLRKSIDNIKHFTSEAYQRGFEAVANMLNFNDIIDGFRRLVTPKEIQNANPTMQRYIMAHDGLRTMYLNGVLDGYEGSFQNIRGDAKGADLYEWRRVNNGMVTVHETPVQNAGIDTHWEATTYYDKIPEGEEDLSFVNRCMMRDVYRAIDEILEDTDIDPTSRLNNSR